MSDLRPGEILKRLNRMGERWPEHFELFSWSGSLCVIDKRKVDNWEHGIPKKAIVGWVRGIHNDGGDPMDLG